MTHVIRPPGERWAPLNPSLAPPVRAWTLELRSLFESTGLSVSRFARLHPIDKGTVSRYLNGLRVPRDRFFLDQVLAHLSAVDKEVTDEVREHAVGLQLRALETAHPHEYRLRLVADELELAVTHWREAERYAADLERQLAQRIRQVEELTAERERLRAAWDDDRAHARAECERLGDETTELRERMAELEGRLELSRERAARAELRCRFLEALMDELEAASGAEAGVASTVTRSGAFPIVAELARRFSFGDIEVWAGSVGMPEELRRPIVALASLGQQVFRYQAADQEGFGQDVPEPLRARARASRVPRQADDVSRGALASLHPTYANLLEIMEVCWERGEVGSMLGTLRTIADYLPLLAWESVFGHAGDPVLIGATVGGTRFGVLPEPGEESRCDHTRQQRAACERVLRVGEGPVEGWRIYLRRQHSTVSAALGVCATKCRTPCGVMTGLDEKVRADLSYRCNLAVVFEDSGLARLWQPSTAGSNLDTWSRQDVEDEWNRLPHILRSYCPNGAPGDAAPDDAFPLPGFPGLVSAIAGVPIRPDTLLHDIAAHIVALAEGNGRALLPAS